MENKNKSVQFFKYAGTAIALLAMFFLGVKFIYKHADATQALYGDKDNQSRITKGN